MEIEAKRQRALDMLTQTGMWKSNYLPPYTRWLWRAGLNIPPPHFCSLWALFSGHAIQFGVTWGILMWLFVWRVQGDSLESVVVRSGCAGLMYGLTMTGYYALGRWRYKLPRWKDV